MALSFTIAGKATIQRWSFLAITRNIKRPVLRVPKRNLNRNLLLRLTEQARCFHVSTARNKRITIRAPPEVQNYDGSNGIMYRFVKQIGDRIEVDEELAEIEKIKHVLEVESNAAGTILELLVSAGDEVRPGEGLAVLETGTKTGSTLPVR